MLEQLYKSLSRFLTDCLNSAISLLKVLIQSKFSVKLPPRQRPLCSVLGNGPSLNDSLHRHLDFITSTEVVCVNNFAHSPLFTQIRPQAYVLADPSYFAFNEQTQGREDIHQTLAAFLQRVDWDMYLYVPHFARGSYLLQKIETGNARIHVVYYNYTIVRGFSWLRHWLYKTNLGMAQSQTVIVAAMCVMLNRRFDAIYLFGADQSWHEQIRLDENNQLLMQQLHFYDKPKDVAYQPVYNATQKRSFTISAMFLSLHKVFRGYEVIREYADYLGVKVYNASSKSYIDAFERVVPQSTPQTSV